MEQKTILAIILSLIVLLTYSAITTRPPSKHQLEKKSQNLENKELKEKISKVLEPENSAKEEISIIKTRTISGEFSNIGGKLKKVIIRKFNYSPPITNIVTINGFENQAFRVEGISANKIFYIFENGEYKISKSYEFIKDYLILAEIRLKVKSEMSKKKILDINNFTVDFSRLDNNENTTVEKSLFEYSISTINGIFRKNNAFNFSIHDKKDEESSVNWVGFRDRYFCTIVKPEYGIQSYLINPFNENILEIQSSTEKMALDEKTYQALRSLIFVGPQDLTLLKSYNVNFEDIINFNVGGFGDMMALGMTDLIAKIILGLIIFFHKILSNWGIAILLLGIFIYFLTYPLTFKSMASMKKMQSLQPEIARIRERNKNNIEKLNKEIMELYKKNKFNPLGGCLPSLLQIPIFISLYQVLWRSVNFKGANFLWIKDLSLPDRLFVLPYPLPLLGQEINILPIILMIIMFFQQRISFKSKVKISKPWERFFVW